MGAPTVIELGSVTLTRVSYIDVTVPPEVVGLTDLELAQVRALDWVDTTLVRDGQVCVGASAWVIGAGDERIVIDPFGNADDIFHDPAHAAAHQAAISTAFDAAGVPIDSVTRVLASHIEGIAMYAVRSDDSRWVPFFPNATISVGEAALVALDEYDDHWTNEAWRQLVADGQVGTFADGEHILDVLVTEHTGGHNPGHHVFHVVPAGADTPAASTVGHLAISPIHLATGPCIPQHPDPQLAWTALRGLADDGRILLGPLWSSPGAGRWRDDAFSWAD